MAGTISPTPVQTFFDSNGDPLNGGFVYTYAAGTSTPLATYTNVGLTVANANPIVLDSAGRAVIFLSAASYKFEVQNSAAVVQWTQDNISATPTTNPQLDVTGTAGESMTAGDALYLSDGSGALTAGRWYKADSDNAYSSTSANALGMLVADASAGDTISVRMIGRVTGLSGLTAGTLYYISATAGAITSSAPANARPFAVADSTTSVILSEWIPVPDASTTLAGKVSTGTQSFAGAKTFTGAVDCDSTLNVDGQVSLDLAPQFYPGTSSTTYATGSGVLNSNITAVGNVGAGEDDLMTYTVPANVLSANGKAIKVTGSFTVTNNANAKTLKFYWNAVAVLSLPLQASIGTPATAECYIYRTSSGNQRIYGTITHADATGTVPFCNFGNTTGTATDTGTIVLKFTATATTNDDISQKTMLVEVLG